MLRPPHVEEHGQFVVGYLQALLTPARSERLSPRQLLTLLPSLVRLQLADQHHAGLREDQVREARHAGDRGTPALLRARCPAVMHSPPPRERQPHRLVQQVVFRPGVRGVRQQLLPRAHAAPSPSSSSRACGPRLAFTPRVSTKMPNSSSTSRRYPFTSTGLPSLAPCVAASSRYSASTC